MDARQRSSTASYPIDVLLKNQGTAELANQQPPSKLRTDLADGLAPIGVTGVGYGANLKP
jgi:hypothetical protein